MTPSDNRMPSARLAFEFLTVLRWRHAALASAPALARSQFWYPTIGLLIGLTLAGWDRLLSGRIPMAPEAVLVLVVLEGISGLLHLDGLADSADGLLGLHSPARRLEIMRDSSTGAFGVATVGFYLLLAFACLESLQSPARGATLIAVPVVGRTAMVVAAATAPYARRDGLAVGFFAAARSWVGACALASSAAIVAVILGASGLLLLLAGAGVGILLAVFARRRAGGITGDVLGAACQLAQVAALVIAVGLQSHSWFRPWL